MSMMFTNNARSKLVEAITADSSSIKINEVDVAKFPSLTDGSYFYLTLVGDGVYEIVKCTNIASNIIDIVRAQDDTTAHDWPVDTIVELRIPAVALNEIVEGIDSKAPKVHTSTLEEGAIYGAGNLTDFGHVRLNDTITSLSDQTNGVAATPYAVKKVYDLVTEASDSASKAQTTADTAVTMATGAVKSVNTITPDSDGNVTLNIDAFPSQTDNEGKFLTTDGTTVSWADIPDAGAWIELDPSITSLDSITDSGYYVSPRNGFTKAITVPDMVKVSSVLLAYPQGPNYTVQTTTSRVPEFLLCVMKGSSSISQSFYSYNHNFTRSRSLTGTTWSKWSFNYTYCTGYDSGSASGYLDTVNVGLAAVTNNTKSESRSPVTLSAYAIHKLVDAIPKVTLSDSVTSTSSTIGASSAAVKLAYDKAVEAASSSSSSAGVPCGTIIYSGSTTTPSGYLKCDGREVSRETYADLFAAIGTAYGAGDGTSTFNLPNLMNVFVEGNATPGTHLAAGLPNITGTLLGRPLATVGNNGGAIGYGSGSFQFIAQDAATSSGNWGTLDLNTNIKIKPDHIVFNAASSSSIYGSSTTVQPESYTAIPYIKAFGTVVNEGSVDVSKFIRTINGVEPDAAGNISVDTSLPLGTIIWSADSTVPEGYLLCDGSAVNRTTYASLFNIIGTTYGAGNGTTTFNLPNLIDKFIEGSTTAGTEKAAGLPDISGYVNSGALAGNCWPVCTAGSLGAFSSSTDNATVLKNTTGTDTAEYKTGITFNASSSNPIYGNSTTVQPPAVTMRPYIKAYESIAKLEAPAITGNGVPVGTVIWNSANSNPNGFLLCDGSAVSRAIYPDLFDAIGTLYGSGDGSTTFNLPNLIDKFIEGGSTSGTSKTAGLPNITTGKITTPDYGVIETSMTGAWVETRHNAKSINTSAGTTADEFEFYFDASQSNSIYGNSTTVQPAAVVMKPFIKAFDTIISTSALNLDDLVSKVTTLENNALLKSGGTMTGTITVNPVTSGQAGASVSINTSDTTHEVQICGGTNLGDGGALILYGANNNYNSYTSGAFTLQVGNGTTTRYLTGILDGTLLWNDINVMPHKSTAAPSSSVGNNGDVWIQYTA